MNIFCCCLGKQIKEYSKMNLKASFQRVLIVNKFLPKTIWVIEYAGSYNLHRASLVFMAYAFQIKCRLHLIDSNGQGLIQN